MQPRAHLVDYFGLKGRSLALHVVEAGQGIGQLALQGRRLPPQLLHILLQRRLTHRRRVAHLAEHAVGVVHDGHQLEGARLLVESLQHLLLHLPHAALGQHLLCCSVQVRQRVDLLLGCSAGPEGLGAEPFLCLQRREGVLPQHEARQQCLLGRHQQHLLGEKLKALARQLLSDQIGDVDLGLLLIQPLRTADGVDLVHHETESQRQTPQQAWIDLLEAGEKGGFLIGAQLSVVQQIHYRVHSVQQPLHLEPQSFLPVLVGTGSVKQRERYVTVLGLSGQSGEWRANLQQHFVAQLMVPRPHLSVQQTEVRPDLVLAQNDI
mmetsp:Transcript_10883/g.32603  ORF Transcript_10883/g.32603 Transcript_10883/m.32603 type:complete len:321 (+) Transcript_10883:2504-3466(+)